MSTTLKVGLAKKVGQPNYGSLAASCHVEFEVEGLCLPDGLDAFQEQVRAAFAACCQAVQEELTRQQTTALACDGTDCKQNFRSASGKWAHRATPHQVRAIEVIAAREQVDLTVLLASAFGVSAASELSRGEASQLIEQMQDDAQIKEHSHER